MKKELRAKLVATRKVLEETLKSLQEDWDRIDDLIAEVTAEREQLDTILSEFESVITEINNSLTSKKISDSIK